MLAWLAVQRIKVVFFLNLYDSINDIKLPLCTWIMRYHNVKRKITLTCLLEMKTFCDCLIMLDFDYSPQKSTIAAKQMPNLKIRN